MRTVTLYRVKITIAGVEKPTRFYTGSPIVFYTKGYHPNPRAARKAEDEAIKRIKDTWSKETVILNTEVVETPVKVAPVKRW